MSNSIVEAFIKEHKDVLRKEFEGHILNNRMDDPRGGSMRRFPIGGEDAYEDPRLSVGWDCWLAATRSAIAQLIPEGSVVVPIAKIELAIQRAEVFDDGGNGADPESARSVVKILRALLSPNPIHAAEPRCKTCKDKTVLQLRAPMKLGGGVKHEYPCPDCVGAQPEGPRAKCDCLLKDLPTCGHPRACHAEPSTTKGNGQ